METISPKLKMVCFGGGHGLGRLLTALESLGENLTGIVTTTDNGGSTGRLRREADTIAWGDLRNCLNQLCREPSIGQLLFEYRFSTAGELNGHNLGNLMLFALEQMSVSPTDAIDVMRELLHIKPRLLPMSYTPVALTGFDGEVEVIGEVEIDDHHEPFAHLGLSHKAELTPEVADALASADGILLSPGSFMTSVMPPLLVDGVSDLINKSKGSFVLVANLTQERLGGGDRYYNLTLDHQLDLLRRAGIRLPDAVLWPSSRAIEPFVQELENVTLVEAELTADGQRHDAAMLSCAIGHLFA